MSCNIALQHSYNAGALVHICSAFTRPACPQPAIHNVDNKQSQQLVEKSRNQELCTILMDFQIFVLFLSIFKDLVRYPLAREGVYAQVGGSAYPIAIGRLINIVGLWPYGQHFCITTILYLVQ